MTNEIKYIKPTDFDDAWNSWIKEVQHIPNEYYINSVEETKYGFLISFYFNSVQNTRVHARLYYNQKSVELDMPLIVVYHGAGGNAADKYYVKTSLFWVDSGFSVLMMDCRNQGGLTIDNNTYSYMGNVYQANGILDKNTVYDKLLYQDALRILMLTRDKNIIFLNRFSNKKVIVTGGSQGGQLSLAVASLSDVPFLCLPDIPSGCALISRIEGRYGKYTAYYNIIVENPNYKELIYQNISYTDLINLTERIKCPVYSSVGTVDDICPMEYYLEAHNKIKTSKEVVYYEGYGHGGFDKEHFPKKLKFVLDYLNK